MINIGLIGESPYDTIAIKHLLQQKYNEGFRYKILLKSIKGDHLESPKANRAAKDEIGEHKPEIIIVIRDLDTHENDAVKIAARHLWYRNLVTENIGKSLLLLNIYELEALILADIKTARAFYNAPKLTFTGNVMAQKEPKEYLKQKTNDKYQVADCPELFLKLDFDTVKRNCTYFRNFISDFEAAIKN